MNYPTAPNRISAAMTASWQGCLAKVWDKRFGGSEDDWAWSVAATSGGGYLLVGDSNSTVSGDKSEASRGGRDLWTVKIDSNGTKVWDKRFGGSTGETTQGVIATADGGYLLVGASESGADGDKSEATRGSSDFWAIKIDADGNK